jgi:hypothetical protein
MIDVVTQKFPGSAHDGDPVSPARMAAQGGSHADL